MACAHCGEMKPIMIPMAPGRDREPWELCSPCWREGREPMKMGLVKVTPIADPHLYNALAAHAERTSSMINMDDARKSDDPKRSTADFDPKPRKKKAS